MGGTLMFWYGALGFLCMFLYDMNSCNHHNERLDMLYPAGVILIVMGIGGQVLTAEALLPLWLRVVTGILAAVFLILLIYTVFIAVNPGAWKRAARRESEPTGPKNVITTGFYALCRHPGLWWFVFFCLLLIPAAGFPGLSAGLYIVFDLLLVLYEDRVSFPLTIRGYDRYKKETPFLLPNRKSALRCRQTLLKK